MLVAGWVRRMIVWGDLLRDARAARGWTQVRACEALRETSTTPLPELPSLLRSWKRWEASTEPDVFYQGLLCNLFGIVLPKLPNMSAVLVTGSRCWEDRLMVERALWLALVEFSLARTPAVAARDRFEVIHGGADGADTMTEEWVDVVRPHHVHVMSRIVRPDYDRYPRWEAPLARNQVMVDTKPWLCIAFHRMNTRGTQDCIDRAVKAGIPTHVYRPGNPVPEVITTLF